MLCNSKPDQSGMPPDRNEVILVHLPLVKAIAAHCRVKLPAHLEFSDLVQAGIVGLLDAVSKYRPETEVSFSTYAAHRIRGAILDSLREEDPAPRKLRRRQRELEKVRGELTQELRRGPTEFEVSERSGIDLASLRATTLDIHYLNQMSGLHCDPEAQWPEQYQDSGAQPDSIYQLKERARLVNDVIQKLPATYRAVITLHYTTDLSLKEIGGSFGVAERQLSRIHKLALQRVHAMLRTRGITAIDGV